METTQLKNYKNKNLVKVVDKLISQKKYGKFTDIIKDICLRRAYIFKLSEEEITMDIKRLLEFCKKVNFSEDFNTYSSVMGRICIKKGLLELNSNYFKTNNDYECMYEVLTHEVYHAMSGKKEKRKKYTGLQYYDEKGEKCGTCLNEVFNEVAADIASISPKKADEENYSRRTNGYKATTFIVDLLAASLGINKIELVKAGITSRDELIDCMLNKIPKFAKEVFTKEFQRFEFNLEKFNKSLNIVDKTDDDKQNIEEAFIDIANFAYDLLYVSIISDKRPIERCVSEEIEYRKNRINGIVSTQILKLPKILSERKAAINSKIGNDSRNRVNSLVVGVNYISRLYEQEKINLEEKKAITAKWRTLFPDRKYRAFSQYVDTTYAGRNIESFVNILTTQITNIEYPKNIDENKYRQRIIQTEYDGFKIWDNTRVSNRLQKIFEEYVQSTEESVANKKKYAVTPKDIVACDKSEKITTEEIEEVERLINTSMLTRENENRNDDRI